MRAHTRLVNGREVEVKETTRGMRTFKWAGYDILITKPGEHHKSLEECDFMVIDEDRLSKSDRKKGLIKTPEFGAQLKEYIEASQRQFR